MCSSWVRCTAAGPTFCSLAIPLRLPPWTQAEPSHTAEVLWCTYHGQSPQTSAGWQSGVEWLTAQDKLSRYNLELLNLSQIQREWAGNQSHSVSLNLSVSLYLSFLSSGSQQLNLAVNFLAKSHRNLYVCVVPVMFRCKPLLRMMAFFFFYEFKRARVWTASYQFQPSVAWSFPQGCVWTMGEGKLAIPCSHEPLRLEH